MLFNVTWQFRNCYNTVSGRWLSRPESASASSVKGFAAAALGSSSNRLRCLLPPVLILRYYLWSRPDILSVLGQWPPLPHTLQLPNAENSRRILRLTTRKDLSKKSRTGTITKLPWRTTLWPPRPTPPRLLLLLLLPHHNFTNTVLFSSCDIIFSLIV